MYNTSPVHIYAFVCPTVMTAVSIALAARCQCQVSEFIYGLQQPLSMSEVCSTSQGL